MSTTSPLTLNVKVGDYTVQMDAAGRLTALRHGKPWRDCVGDNLILALAQEVEQLRTALGDAEQCISEMGEQMENG